MSNFTPNKLQINNLKNISCKTFITKERSERIIWSNGSSKHPRTSSNSFSVQTWRKISFLILFYCPSTCSWI